MRIVSELLTTKYVTYTSDTVC